MTHNARYTLQPFAGRKTRHTCPACRKPHEFTRYLDTATQDLLPEMYGRCNREAECGYFLTPYDRSRTGQSYADEVRQNQAPTANARYCPRPAPPLPAPLGIIPEEVVSRSMSHYHRNTFARLLVRLYGGGVADELLRRFEVGTSNYWQGATIFWQRDESGRMRAGQVVLFNEAGYTVKQPLPDGSKRRLTSWVHKALEQAHRQQNQPLPEWLREYLRPEVAKSPYLYGLAQLAEAPAGQPVALTEAPKTAILAQPYLPAFLWMAVGSLSYLTAARLAPIKTRRIVFWPDASTSGRAYQLWAAKAAELRGQGFDITVSDYLETTCTEEQKAQGWDLADLILNDHPGYPLDWDATA